MDSPGKQDSKSSLRRALILLDTFTPERAEMSLRELARRSGIARSTAHRLVQELLEWGALERGANGLHLGLKLFELGSVTPSQLTLRDAASLALHGLNQMTQLTSNLAIREDRHVVYLDKITSHTLKVPHSRLGGRGALHATALGKAILAFSAQELVDEVCDTSFEPITHKTIVDFDVFRAEIEQVRREKCAYDLEESHLGLFCIAAPILQRGRAIAAISLTGATARSQVERLAPVTIAAARMIEKQLNASARTRSPTVGNEMAR